MADTAQMLILVTVVISLISTTHERAVPRNSTDNSIIKKETREVRRILKRFLSKIRLIQPREGRLGDRRLECIQMDFYGRCVRFRRFGFWG